MMMIIKRDSWHYRFLDAWNCYQSENLCPYVRQVLGYTALTLFCFLIATIVMVGFTYPIWRWWFFIDSDGLVGFLCGLLWIGAGVIVIKLYREEWYASVQWLNNPRFYKEGMFDLTKWYHRQLIPKWFQGVSIPRPSHDNIALEYIRAAHNKVCPGIKFE